MDTASVKEQLVSKAKERDKIEKFVEILGSEPLWTTVEEHDRALAYTGHAPYFVSLTTKKIGGKFKKHAGPGYFSMTGLVKQDPKLGEAFKLYNAHNKASALRTVILNSGTKDAIGAALTLFIWMIPAIVCWTVCVSEPSCPP